MPNVKLNEYGILEYPKNHSVPRHVPKGPPGHPLAAQVAVERALQRAAKRRRPPHPDDGELPPGDCHRNVAVVTEGQWRRQHFGPGYYFTKVKTDPVAKWHNTLNLQGGKCTLGLCFVDIKSRVVLGQFMGRLKNHLSLESN